MVESHSGVAALPRVLHVVHGLPQGGLETMVEQIVTRSGAEFEHSVCCIREIGTVGQRLQAHGIAVHCLAEPPGHRWRTALHVAQICRRVQPAVVHTHNWGGTDGIVAGCLTRTAVIVHTQHCRSETIAEPRRRVLGLRLFGHLAQRVVAVSEDVRNWLVEIVRLPLARVVVIPNAIDTQAFQPRADRAELRRALGFRADEIVVGSVGRLAAVKHYSLLIEAVRQLLGNHPSLRLVLIGEGEERLHLAASIREHGLGEVVRLVGERHDVAEWLAALDIFALPSLSEGTSLALLEAMAAGCPVIATRTGGNHEVVVDGVSGCLVPTNDCAALVQALASYCANPQTRHQHALAARARVREKYDVVAAIAAYERLYLESIGKARPDVAA